MSATPLDSIPQSAIRNPQSAIPRLIAITDAASMPGGWPAIVDAAKAALHAGLPALMLRDRQLADAELLPYARELRQITRETGARLIVNRRLELAREIGADGIHLGAYGGPSIGQARQALGPDALIGYSTHRNHEALDVIARGVDYITFSPIFATPSKAGILEPTGLTPLASLARRAPGQVIALGGIDQTNLSMVMHTGVAGAAVIRAIFGQPAPAQSTRELLKVISTLN